MDYRTFDEWKRSGFHVIKGQKAHKRNELGQAVFCLSQVSQNIHRGHRPLWMQADVDYEDALEWEFPH